MEPEAFTAMLQRSILGFAEAIAATPADEPARHQPQHHGNRRNPAPRMKRDVLIEGMIAAADLLNDALVSLRR